MTSKEILKKQIIYRSSHRGSKEMDLLLGAFVNNIINKLKDEELKDLEEILKSVKIDVRIIGADWKGKDFTGKELAGNLHKIVYNTRQHSFSSSELRKRIKEGK